jgi:hypothetical protein
MMLILERRSRFDETDAGMEEVRNCPGAVNQTHLGCNSACSVLLGAVTLIWCISLSA